MRVLIWDIHDDDFTGGNRIQRVKTAEALRALGVDVTVVQGKQAELAGYDLVHAFGLRQKQLRQCRLAGLPIAYSTIYWPLGDRPPAATWREALGRLRGRSRSGWSLFRECLRGRKFEACSRATERWQDLRVRFEMADLLLPNSVGEGECIRRDLGVTTPYHVVPNAADPTGFTPDGPDYDDTGRRYVTCVARIEPHKNQLGLVEAMRGTDYPVLIVGPHWHEDNERYYQRCQRRATSNIRFLGRVSDEQLVRIYRSTKVHALVSDAESTGLSSLEAALCGANVVTTERGFTRDYFDGLAWFCQYNDPASIREAVKAAYAAPFQTALRDKTLREYTWEETAKATLAGYESFHEGTRARRSAVCV